MDLDAVSEPPGPPSDRAAFQVPSVLRCGLMIFAVKVALKTFGFGHTLRWIRRHVEGVPLRDGVHIDVVKAAEQEVAIAAALYPGRARCLEQSLVLYLLLYRAGVPVEFWMGAQAYPFLGHAWIQYRGQPINDVPEHIKRFTTLPALLP